MFRKSPIPTLAAYQAAWIAVCAPHVPEPVSTVALFNPPGAMAAQGAAVAGRSLGGLVGRTLAKKAAEMSVAQPDRPLPDVLAGALTASALHLFEVEIASADGDELRIFGLFETWDRRGLRLGVERKVMSERLTFTWADGTSHQLDGMFVGRQKERLYQPLIDELQLAAADHSWR